MIRFVVPADQDWSITGYLATHGAALAPQCDIIHYEELPRRSSFSAGTYVFKAIDQLSPAMCGLAAELHTALGAAGARTINDPARTLLRYDLLTELRRRGLNAHGVARAGADLSQLRFPVFLRAERSHDGNLSPILHSAHDINAAIGHALVRGYRFDDLLVVEFADTSDADGWFRKYGAYVVGSRIVPRSVAYARHWMIKQRGTHYTRDILEEERAYVLENPHERELHEVARIANVEYGRIDYSVKDGRLFIWEINLNPTLGRPRNAKPLVMPEELRPFREGTRDMWSLRYVDAFRAIDTAPSVPATVPIHLDERLAHAASVVPQHGRAIAIVRSALHPLKPLIQPLVRRAMPVIGRIMRYRSKNGRRR